MRKFSERLLPRTEAIPRLTAQWEHYKDGFLVRYRNAEGSVTQRFIHDPEEAQQLFLEMTARLKEEVRNAQANPSRWYACPI
jgi:hypothetical protein